MHPRIEPKGQNCDKQSHLSCLLASAAHPPRRPVCDLQGVTVWTLCLRLPLRPCRRFGRVRLQQDPASHPPVSKLGFDPLLGMPTLEEFRGLMAKQRRMLKVVIMDQVKCTLRAVPTMQSSQLCLPGLTPTSASARYLSLLAHREPIPQRAHGHWYGQGGS